MKQEWEPTYSWITEKENLLIVPCIEVNPFVRKWVDIPVLKDYNVKPDASFWENFPKNPMPQIPQSKVNAKNLNSLVVSMAGRMTCHQVRRGLKVCEDLRMGASAFQNCRLPSITVPNVKSAYEHGEMLTDKIATWIDTKYVAGPFDFPPLMDFRVNPMMAIKKHNTVRPVINLSAPLGLSFNDNVKLTELEKVIMSTAQMFSYSVMDAGINAKMSKYDLKDAYKNIPARKKDWHLQGFTWLGKYFFETQMIFGGIPSVCNFDRLGNTILTLATIRSGIPRHLVHRTLDDIPVVCPENSGYCEKFSEELEKICSIANVILAEECPKCEKAFVNKTEGTVLGIRFHTKTLEWSLPKDKADELQTRLLTAVGKKCVNLLEMQEILGTVNHFSQMCPFINGFRMPCNLFLSEFKNNSYLELSIPPQVRKDILVVLRASETARCGLPIPVRPSGVPLGHLTFISDAAGSSFNTQNGIRMPNNVVNDRGVASIGYSKEKVWFKSVVTWPMNLINCATDGKGAKFGSKMTTLELVGLLLPFLTIPDVLIGRNIVLEVDNISVIYGFKKVGTKKDLSASILLKSLHMISYYLGCTLHLKHVHRDSTAESCLVDRLSRKATTTTVELSRVGGIRNSDPPFLLMEWLENPTENWDFAVDLLNYVMSVVKM